MVNGRSQSSYQLSSLSSCDFLAALPVYLDEPGHGNDDSVKRALQAQVLQTIGPSWLYWQEWAD